MFGTTKSQARRERNGDDPGSTVPILREPSAKNAEGNSYGSANVTAVSAEAAAAAAGPAAEKRTFLSESLVRGLAYGMVNGILLPPVSVSFAAIIFRDPAFAEHLPRLVKLVMFSAGVHMGCFGTLSSLEFCVGSVQDAGLIFLSAIASAVVVFSREQGMDEAAMLSTSCFVLCTCTGLLGVALVVLGRLRLASIVQYLPMPVIGGYLAFIGYFCGQAGLAFASGLEITNIGDLRELANSESLALVVPAVVAGVIMYLCLRRFPSPMTLPLLMAAFLAIFFSILGVTGTSLEDARSLGWVSAASPMLPLTRAWDYFSFENVRWDALVRVLPNLMAMTVVVAFSSCLDVAAIEMEMGTPLDFNGELQTVGWSNVVSGLLGGFTGSYIFSQTIFNLRAGVNTRVAGATTCFMLVSAAASPVSVISFLPRAFFGSLLVLISVDLMVEWLWQARLRMMPAEYLVCLATFVAIQAWGVEEGMLAGLILAALSFTVTYAQVPTVMTARVKSSTVMRTFEERVILQAHGQQTVVLELQGYIFFGSAVKILSDVKKRIVWGTDHPDDTKVDNNTFTDDSNTRYQQQQQQQQYPSTPPQSPHNGQHLRNTSAHVENAAAYSNAGSAGAGGGGGSLLSPVFSRSGAVYPSSSSTPNSSSVRGWHQRRHARRASAPRDYDYPNGASATTRGSQQQHQQGRPTSAAANGGFRHPAMARTMSEGNGVRRTTARGADASPSFGGGTGGPVPRPPAAGDVEESIHLVDGPGGLEDGDGVGVGGSSSGVSSISASGRGYGTVEAGERGGGRSNPLRRGKARGTSFGSDPRRAAVSGDRAVQAYLSLWASGGAGDIPGHGGYGGGFGRSGRLASVSSQLPVSEQRTRRVVLDFSNVVGVDATAARSCFLMLKLVLKTSGAEVVFSGAAPKVQALLRSHGVITNEDPVFSSIDTALEWSEEMMLKERRSGVLLGQGGGATWRSSLMQTPTQSTDASGPGGTENHDQSLAQSALNEEEGLEESPKLPCAEAEAAVFLGNREEYYERAGLLRRRGSMVSRIANADVDDPPVVGDVGSLQSILEDYLEVDRYQAPESVRGLLRQAGHFFEQEHVAAGAILADTNVPSSCEKLYFIGAGSVDLQVDGEFGPRRLLRVCAGGTFGEVGFYLRTPQAFRAITREPCHLHTLDREGMATMQRQNPGLCVLVQKAVLKSICLAASLSIESAHMAPVDDGRASWLAGVAIEDGR